MKKLTLLSGVIVLLILMLVPAPALAFNPQSELPAKLKLEAVINVLERIDHGILKIRPHLHQDPIRNPEGAIGELEGMANQLDAMHKKVSVALIKSVGEGGHVGEGHILKGVLEEVRDSAGGIYLKAYERWMEPCNDCRPAWEHVMDNAQAIEDLANDFLVLPA